MGFEVHVCYTTDLLLRSNLLASDQRSFRSQYLSVSKLLNSHYRWCANGKASDCPPARSNGYLHGRARRS